ncbi:hypothetical protein PPL_00545 [Heterostelium album PN500]|uniref:Uncharacterized protein n=1 Tax=Heterostelium pallidum (strain ATCC 26659 / Pp 5 / PN500) TaxID=670386 RepID=D3AWR7_HETP5|nr:hypothetical protein PPL_00545 [Heterostelium album PN500]EFA86740.1 hypothetical protein PPL_00545 [Heterostelium album PN500]|eukprot:XP_020438844.1 hypothetical protein PPL_00545 [Heterostelium album PN500]
MKDRFIVSLFIIVFLLVQSYFPLRYYYLLLVNDNNKYNDIDYLASLGQSRIDSIPLDQLLALDDERFVWRMFSPTSANLKCTANYFFQHNQSRLAIDRPATLTAHRYQQLPFVTGNRWVTLAPSGNRCIESIGIIVDCHNQVLYSIRQSDRQLPASLPTEFDSRSFGIGRLARDKQRWTKETVLLATTADSHTTLGRLYLDVGGKATSELDLRLLAAKNDRTGIPTAGRVYDQHDLW